MTKMPARPSYLQQIARRPSAGQSLLNPPHAPMGRWTVPSPPTALRETLLTMDRPAAVVPPTDSLPVRPGYSLPTVPRPASEVTEPGAAVPSLEASAQRPAEQQPALPMDNAPEAHVSLNPPADRTPSRNARQPALRREKQPPVGAVLLDSPSSSTAQTPGVRAQRQPTLLTGKASRGEELLEAGAPARASDPRTPGALSSALPEIEHARQSVPLTGSQRSAPEIRPAPGRSVESTGNIALAAHQPSPAARNTHKESASNLPPAARGVESGGSLSVGPSSTRGGVFLDTRGAPASVALALPDSAPQDLAAPTEPFLPGVPLGDELPSRPVAKRSAPITLVPHPPERPATSIPLKTKEQPTSIHIGAIEVQIVPPPVPPTPLPVPRPAQPRQRFASPLSRELTSFIGLRQE